MSRNEARWKGFRLYLHQLLEGVVAGTQLGHRESCGDTQGREENVVVVILGVRQVLVEGGGKTGIGSGQFPDSPVGGLGDLLLCALLLDGLLLCGPVDAHGIHGNVPGLGRADVLHGAPVTGHTAPEANEQQGQKIYPPRAGQKAALSLLGQPVPDLPQSSTGFQPSRRGREAGPKPRGVEGPRAGPVVDSWHLDSSTGLDIG